MNYHRDFISKAVEEQLRSHCKELFYKFKHPNVETDITPDFMRYSELAEYSCSYDMGVKLQEITMKTITEYQTLDYKLNLNVPEKIKELLGILYKESKNSFIVGGCTRDIIIGKEPKDYDFVTDIPYGRLREMFKDYETKETGTEFLVLNLKYRGEMFEIANFRCDIYAEDNNGNGANSVRVGTIEEDIRRRDFSVNAIFWNFDGVVADYQSVLDINSNTLRFVGNPDDRLKEDFMRGFRFYRFLNKGFNADKKSLQAVRRNWEKIYSNCNSHRVMMELEKLSEI